VHIACNLSFIVKNEGVFKVIVSHVHFKSGSISGMKLDRHCNNRPLTGRDVRPMYNVIAAIT